MTLNNQYIASDGLSSQKHRKRGITNLFSFLFGKNHLFFTFGFEIDILTLNHQAKFKRCNTLVSNLIC